MKLIEIFEKGIKLGLEYDLRKDIDNKIFYGLKKNPYPDSLIVAGNNQKKINNLFVCIDIDVSTLLLVNEIIKKGTQIDGILSHHPTGKGMYNIIKVIELQKENWQRAGIREAEAQKLFEKIYSDESIETKGNYNGPENAANLLEIPLICLHTPIDNIVQNFFEDFFVNKQDLGVDEVLNEVKDIPECKMASENGDVPMILKNNKSEIVGRYFIDMTGGVDPPDRVFKLLKKAGINTIVGMHYNLDNVKAIIESRLSAFICGHMACDSIGMNIFCDFLEKEGVNIISGSGFYRFKRNEKN